MSSSPFSISTSGMAMPLLPPSELPLSVWGMGSADSYSPQLSDLAMSAAPTGAALADSAMFSSPSAGSSSPLRRVSGSSSLLMIFSMSVIIPMSLRAL